MYNTDISKIDVRKYGNNFGFPLFSRNQNKFSDDLSLIGTDDWIFVTGGMSDYHSQVFKLTENQDIYHHDANNRIYLRFFGAYKNQSTVNYDIKYQNVYDNACKMLGKNIMNTILAQLEIFNKLDKIEIVLDKLQECYQEIEDYKNANSIKRESLSSVKFNESEDFIKILKHEDSYNINGFDQYNNVRSIRAIYIQVGDMERELHITNNLITLFNV